MRKRKCYRSRYSCTLRSWRRYCGYGESGDSPTQSTGGAAFVTQNILNRFDSPMTCSNFFQIIRLKDEKCASILCKGCFFQF